MSILALNIILFKGSFLQCGVIFGRYDAQLAFVLEHYIEGSLIHCPCTQRKSKWEENKVWHTVEVKSLLTSSLSLSLSCKISEERLNLWHANSAELVLRWS